MNLPVTGISVLNIIDWVNFKFKQSIDFLFLPFDYSLDTLSFWCHSRLSLFSSEANKKTYDLVFFAHTIEKGLSLPEPREQFGRNNIARVIRILKSGMHKEGLMFPDYAVAMGMGSLEAYLRLHKDRDVSSAYLMELETEFNSLKAYYSNYGDGGHKEVLNVSKWIENSTLSYSEFLSSRYSCRNFRTEAITASLLSEIVNVAQQAPSQCNRQSVRLHVYQDTSTIQLLLSLQGGAKGFSQQVPTLVVVTSDLCAWMSRAERNQCYLDSGIYAMSLLLAIHARGLGACPLNFSKTFLAEREFKKRAKIPNGERVALLVAVGWPSDSHSKAACSTRNTAAQVINFH